MSDLDFSFDDLPTQKLQPTPLEAAINATKAEIKAAFDPGEPKEALGTIPAPAPTPPAEVVPTISPQIRFKVVHEQLLKYEKLQNEGKPVDLKHVQKLVNEASELIYEIQTSTTGPKKKAPVMDADPDAKTKRAPRAKKASTIAHLNIPDGDDF